MALLISSYVFSIPVFVLSAGVLATHMIVASTPGPLVAMADTLNVDLGVAIFVGTLVAIPTSLVAGLVYGAWIDDQLTIPLREALGSYPDALIENTQTPLADLPGLEEAALPIGLPLLLIGSNTIVEAVASDQEKLSAAVSFLGDPIVALTAAAIIAATTYYRQSNTGASVFNKCPHERIEEWRQRPRHHGRGRRL